MVAAITKWMSGMHRSLLPILLPPKDTNIIGLHRPSNANPRSYRETSRMYPTARDGGSEHKIEESFYKDVSADGYVEVVYTYWMFNTW